MSGRSWYRSVRPIVSHRITNYLPPPRDWLAVLLGTMGLAGLCVIGQYNFVLFHCLTEAFTITIAIAVFAIFWNTRQFIENDAYLMILGFGCLFAGILDIIAVLQWVRNILSC